MVVKPNTPSTESSLKGRCRKKFFKKGVVAKKFFKKAL